MSEDINSIFGNRIRLRICGLCWAGDKLLMVNHQFAKGVDFWSPPGGGLEFGQSAEEALKREFLEETGLIINVGAFRFITEFIQSPFHAVELFFDTTIAGGELKIGTDPEMSSENQIIKQVEFVDWSSVKAIPNAQKHGILKNCKDLLDLKTLTGFYAI